MIERLYPALLVRAHRTLIEYDNAIARRKARTQRVRHIVAIVVAFPARLVPRLAVRLHARPQPVRRGPF